MDREKFEKAVKLSETIEHQKECLSLIEFLRKGTLESEYLSITVGTNRFQIPEELETPIFDLLTGYYNNNLSELEKEFDELW